MKERCSRCGNGIEEQASFCYGCGAPVGAPAVQGGLQPPGPGEHAPGYTDQREGQDESVGVSAKNDQLPLRQLEERAYQAKDEVTADHPLDASPAPVALEAAYLEPEEVTRPGKYAAPETQMHAVGPGRTNRRRWIVGISAGACIIIAAALATVFVFRTGDTKRQAKDRKTVQAVPASQTGGAIDQIISEVAFVRNGDVFIGKCNGEEISDERQMTFDGNNFEPCWSADGKRIAFVHKNPGTGYKDTIEIMENSASGQRLRSVRPSCTAYINIRFCLGEDSMYLLDISDPKSYGYPLVRGRRGNGRCEKQGVNCFAFDVSRDGGILYLKEKQLVFDDLRSSSRPDSKPVGGSTDNKNAGVVLSTDGKQAACYDSQEKKIVLYEITDGKLERDKPILVDKATTQGGNIILKSFTPDGQHISYFASTGNTSFLLDIASGKSVPLEEECVVFSPIIP